MYCTPSSARLGPPEVAPLGDARHDVALDVDPPEEVVRRQEHQVAAAVAEALDGVVLALVTYSWWPGKTMQLVRLRERGRRVVPSSSACER